MTSGVKTSGATPPSPPPPSGFGPTRAGIGVQASAEESAAEDADGVVRISSWLTSIVVHLIVLIVLALLSYTVGGSSNGVSIDGGWADPLEDSAVATIDLSPAPQLADRQSEESPVPVEIPQTDLEFAQPRASDTAEQIVSDEAVVALLKSGGGDGNSLRRSFLGGGGLASRTPEGRIRYGERFGATAESEQAVENALRWLAEHQRADGSWSFDLSLSPCEGRCEDGRPKSDDTPTPATAATGLALLAFLGAGYTPHSGPYQQTVSKGLYYLRSAALETSHGYDWQQGGSMYGHGIAMMAMSEALGMTKLQGEYDSDLLHYVSEGARFTMIAQHPNGSWGYVPGSPGDTTLTGWQVLSLIGAVKAGVPMHSETLSRAKSFLMSVREAPTYQFGYKTPKGERTTTAIGLALMMYLGQTPGYTPFDEQLDVLAEQGPTLTNVYHDYYATLALHHFRHREWEDWNRQLRDHLVKTQETSGHEAGSWHFSDRWGNIGGRVYTTAMCTLILEVYYRFLPLYDAPPEFPL